MDPVSLILAALAAGAAKGITDTAAGAIADLYQQLKSTIRRRFHGNSKAETVLDLYIDDPETYDRPMKKQVTEAGLDADQQIVALARAILENVDPIGKRQGKYFVDARGARNVQTGEHSTQYNY